MRIIRAKSFEQFKEIQRALKALAKPDCEDCGGTGDVDPAMQLLQPCKCVLGTKVTHPALSRSENS